MQLQNVTLTPGQKDVISILAHMAQDPSIKTFKKLIDASLNWMIATSYSSKDDSIDLALNIEAISKVSMEGKKKRHLKGYVSEGVYSQFISKVVEPMKGKYVITYPRDQKFNNKVFDIINEEYIGGAIYSCVLSYYLNHSGNFSDKNVVVTERVAEMAIPGMNSGMVLPIFEIHFNDRYHEGWIRPAKVRIEIKKDGTVGTNLEIGDKEDFCSKDMAKEDVDLDKEIIDHDEIDDYDDFDR